MTKRLLLIFFLPLFMFANGQPNTTINPSNNLPALKQSVINIPIKLYAKPYLYQAEAVAPEEFLSEGWPEYIVSSCEFRYKYRFVRSALSFSCIDNKMTVNFSGKYQIAGSKTVCAFGKQVYPWISGSCGFGDEPMRRVNISINSMLEFQPDYTLKTTTLPEKITAIDKCTMTILHSDVTQQVIDSIGASVAAFGNSMDQQIASLRFSDILQTLGEKAGKKIPMGGYGYIRLNPSSVKAGRVNLSGDTLHFTIGLTCFPEISSDSTNNYITDFLPPLASGELTPGFTVNTNAVYEYAALDTILNRSFRDKAFDLDGRNIIITNIEVSGLEDHQVELRIDFDGNKKGTVYFSGTPVLDVENQVLTIPDLDYALKSRNIFLNVGKALFNKKIMKALREKGTLSINELFQKNKADIDSVFNRTVVPGIYTAGNTTGFRVTGLVIKKDNLLIQTSITGNIAVIAR